MLRLDKIQTIEGVTVFADDSFDNVYYVSPTTIRYRRDERGLPILRLLQYHMPGDEQSEPRRGYCLLALEFGVPEEKLADVAQVLQDQLSKSTTPGELVPTLRLEPIDFAKGTVKVPLGLGDYGEGDPMVTPSSFVRKNTVLFDVDLSNFEELTMAEGYLELPEGFPVVAELEFWGKLPPASVKVSFDASRLFDSYPPFEHNWPGDPGDAISQTYKDTVSRSGACSVEVDFGAYVGDIDEELASQIRERAMRKLEQKVERQLMFIQGVRDWAWRTQEDAIGQVGEGAIGQFVDTLQAVFQDTIASMTSFSEDYYEDILVKKTVKLEASVPPITDLRHSDGTRIEWKGHYIEELYMDDFLQ